MTRQEYYDLLVRSAYDGTFPSTAVDAIDVAKCRYRADQTALCKQRCAIGLLIPDERYYEKMEGMYLRDLLCLIQDLPDGLDYDSAAEIQGIHDEVALSLKWNQVEFISRINTVDYFQGVTKKEVQS